MATRLIAIALALLTLLPVANLLAGGEQDPEYAARMLDWLNGAAICAVVAMLVGYIARLRDRHRPFVAPIASDAVDPTSDVPATDWRFLWIAALGAFALYAITAWFVLSAKPLLIDEVVQVLQARWYVDGHLWVPPAPLREFFSITHVVDMGDRVYGQFPPGGPAMLALGSLLHAEWLVGPASGAVSVALFARLLDHLEPGETVHWRRGATALFALAPFGVFMFASHMNHATTLAWLLAAIVALAQATAREDAPPAWAFIAGIGLGVAATIRPLDALAFALPTAGWLLLRARSGRPAIARLLLSGLGVAIPIAAMMYVNVRTTGAPLRFGYDVLWGPTHSLGFHESPWGLAHTPSRGLELVSIQFTRLSTYLFELPIPAMLLVAAGLWFSRGLRSLDRYLLAASGLVVVGYWAYWHDGFFLGPRFYFPLLPALVLWTSRLPRSLEARLGVTSVSWVALRAATATAAVLAVISLGAIRIPSYRNGLTSMRRDIAATSARAGVHDALVLVRESWGARLVVRMWALGVDRPMAERIYRHSDVCRLELTLSALESGEPTEREPTRRDATLRALMTDSATLVRSLDIPGFTESVSPYFAWPERCRSLRALDETGHSHLAPFRLAQDGNVYARWLPGREAEIHALYPRRPLYLLERAGPDVDAPVTWRRLADPLE